MTEAETKAETKTELKTTIRGKVRELNRIALPLIIQNLSTTAILMADVAIIGRLSPAAFNAVGVVSGLFSLVAGIAGYFSVQFNIVGGKASVKDPQGFTDEFASALILNAAVGLLLFLFMLFFNRPLFALLYGFEGEMLDIAATYASIISVYLPIQLLIFSFNALLKIRRNTKWILFASVGVSLFNLLLNFIFIIVLGFGIRAAAATSIAAIAVKLLVFVVVCKKEICLCAGRLHIYRQKALALARGSLPLMGQELLEGGVFALAITAVVTRLGDYPLSAFIVLTHILAFAQLPMFMYGSALLTLVSQVTQAQRKVDLALLPKVAFGLSAGIYVAVTALLYMFRAWLPAVITGSAAAASIAAAFLIVMAVAKFFETSGTVYKYALQAVGQAKFVLYGTAAVNAVTLGLLVAATQVFGLGLWGVFGALFLNYLGVSAMYVVKYRRVS